MNRSITKARNGLTDAVTNSLTTLKLPAQTAVVPKLTP